MKYALIKDGVVIQVQPYEEDGFVEVDDNVFPGQTQGTDGSFFVYIDPTELVVRNADAIKFHMRAIIESKWPVHIQLEALERKLELLGALVAGSALTTEQIVERDVLDAEYARRKAIKKKADDAIKTGILVDSIVWPE